MRIQRAIVRPPAETLADGITAASLGVPLFETARAQHAAYCSALRAAGVAVTALAPDPSHPDAHFVEDTAVLTTTRAILTRPGAAARLGEVAAIREPLEAFFALVDAIESPGTLDGGDVCDAGERVYIGLSHRTNLSGAQQLARLLARSAKTSTLVDIRSVPGVLHLKSALSYLGDGRFVASDTLASLLEISARAIVRVESDEAYGANCVRVNDVVLIPTGHPRLRAGLERAGYSTVALDVSEFRKMDGGLSCLSLRF